MGDLLEYVKDEPGQAEAGASILRRQDEIETFRQRLREGKSVSHVYQAEGRTGLINVWLYEDKFVLSWEECPEGDVYNEQNYTRDEVHHFKNTDDVLEFLTASGVDPILFAP